MAQYLCNGKLNLLNNKIKNWRAKKGFTTGWGNIAEKILLVISELTEAFEAFRDLSPKLITQLKTNPNLRPSNTAEAQALDNFKEELADTYVRLGDLVASLGIDMETWIDRKMQINEKRPIKHNRHR